MVKAGIVIDDWKLSIFEETLKAEGYQYTYYKGFIKGTIILKVNIESVIKFKPVVERINKAAAISRAH